MGNGFAPINSHSLCWVARRTIVNSHACVLSISYVLCDCVVMRYLLFGLLHVNMACSFTVTCHVDLCQHNITPKLVGMGGFAYLLLHHMSVVVQRASRLCLFLPSTGGRHFGIRPHQASRFRWRCVNTYRLGTHPMWRYALRQQQNRERMSNTSMKLRTCLLLVSYVQLAAERFWWQTHEYQDTAWLSLLLDSLFN